MELFQKNGHLSEAAILALINGESLPELSRLEAAEHLAYCDICLHHYTTALSGQALLTPERSCQQTLMHRIRTRTARILASRYTTAAAAVTVALTLLWADLPSPDHFTILLPERGSYEELFPKRWNDTFSLLSEHLNSFFDGFNRSEDGGNKT